MATHHLAQINIGTLKAPMDAPGAADFAANLDPINALAEAQAGFVWRLTGAGNNATDLSFFDDPLTILNMSLWTDLDSLAAFVYRTGHRQIMRRRAEWFERMEIFMCLWWVPIGRLYTPREGIERLAILRRLGPTMEAFTFREPFAAPGVVAAPAAVLDECA